MSPRRPSPVLAPIALAVVLLAGCTTAPHTQPDEDVTDDVDVSTCGEFLELDAAAQAEVKAEGTSVTLYTADGATSYSPGELYALRCADLPASTSLADIYYGVDDADVPTTNPICAEFLVISSTAQESWLEQLVDEEYNQLGRVATVDEMTRFCALGSGATLVYASNYIRDFPSLVEWTTESQLGYTTAVTLGVGTALTGDEITHPVRYSSGPGGIGTGASDAPPFVAGTACPYDPATDAAVPIRDDIVDTTDGDLDPDSIPARFRVRVTGTTVTTAYVESSFSDGATCSDMVSGAGVVISSSCSRSGCTGSHFLILKNWFSPRYPGGATGDLAAYVLSGEAPQDSEDPVTLTAPAAIRLDGSLP